MENRQLNFDVSRGGIQHRLFVRVGDARSRTVTARMYSGSEAIPITAANIRALRPDGTQIYSPCTVQDGEVVYTFATEDLACGGELQCEFDLHNGESVMTSPRFIVVCEKLLYTGEGIETSDEYQAYIAALLKLENLSVDAVGGAEASVTKEVTETGIALHFTLPKGDKGEAPRIGDNGNWYVYDNATQKWVDTGVRAGGSADFAESDNTAPAYIRNRPFGVVEGVLAEQALHFTAAGDTYSCDAVTSAALVLGEKYRIIWDGMEYFCTAESNISGGGITITGNYLGNPAQFLTSGDMGDTGEPFFIAGNAGVAGISVFSTDGDTDHTIRIERVKLLHTGWLSEAVAPKEYVQKELDAANTAIDVLETEIAKCKTAYLTDSVLYAKSPFVNTRVEDGVLYADGGFSSAKITNNILYVK